MEASISSPPLAELTSFSPEAVDTREQDTSHFDALIPEMSTPQLQLGLDTIDISTLRGLQFFWLAGYAGGIWPTFHPMCLAYPQLAKAGRIFSYAVSASEDADLCDCERGDLSVGEVPGWLARQFGRGAKKPGVYGSWDTWTNGGLHDAVAHYGGNIRRIVAHYTYVPQLAHPGFDAQQFTDHYANRNIDGNVAMPSMFTSSVIEHVNPLHYERFGTGPYPTQKWGKLNERQIVEEYDGARKHPQQYKYYLPLLEAKLQWLANRVAFEAIHHHPLPNGKANWADNWNGWRYQQLVHRAQGVQFAK